MPLKNYTSEMPINRIFDRLQKVLVSHGAKQIMMEYDHAGKAVGMTFVVQKGQRLIPIKLPARVDNVKKVLHSREYE